MIRRARLSALAVLLLAAAAPVPRRADAAPDGDRLLREAEFPWYDPATGASRWVEPAPGEEEPPRDASRRASEPGDSGRERSRSLPAGGGPGVPAVLLYAILGAGLALVAWLVVTGTAARSRLEGTPGKTGSSDGRRTPAGSAPARRAPLRAPHALRGADELLASAREAARTGRFAAAARDYLAYRIALLETQGRLRRRRSATWGDYLREVGDDPHLAARLRASVRQVEAAVFGGRDPGREGWEELLRLWETAPAAEGGDRDARRETGSSPGRSLSSLLPLLAALLASGTGCSPGHLETEYGHTSGLSVNGSRVFAGLLEEAGWSLRRAFRLSPDGPDRAELLLWFDPGDGAPPWLYRERLLAWLRAAPDRTLLYVPWTREAAPEYWNVLLESGRLSPAQRERAEAARERALEREDRRAPAPGARVFPGVEWIPHVWGGEEVLVPRDVHGPLSERALAGGRRASLRPRGAFQLGERDAAALLRAGSLALAARIPVRRSQAIVSTSAFLLNHDLADPARRDLARALVEELGAPGRAVVLEAPHEGRPPLSDAEASQGRPSTLRLLTLPPWRWIFLHLLALGLAGTLARLPRIGRPRGARLEPPGFGAHVEALAARIAEAEAAEARRTRRGAPHEASVPPPAQDRAP